MKVETNDLVVEFHDFSKTFHNHSHFPWLSRPENSFLKFHDFPRCVGTRKKINGISWLLQSQTGISQFALW